MFMDPDVIIAPVTNLVWQNRMDKEHRLEWMINHVFSHKCMKLFIPFVQKRIKADHQKTQDKCRDKKADVSNSYIFFDKEEIKT